MVGGERELQWREIERTKSRCERDKSVAKFCEIAFPYEYHTEHIKHSHVIGCNANINSETVKLFVVLIPYVCGCVCVCGVREM